jgi:ubiquinone/menaquinone biosynthesis C-methylase UbiE
MGVQSHRSDPKILGRRTLERDHRFLAGLLRPGMSVLDAGCGTGAITSGIARVVGPDGLVVGVDRDEGNLSIARQEHTALANLRFEHGDATELRHGARFDIVTAARTLQWIAQPGRAVISMKQATRHGGLVVVLDYSHAKNGWEPDPPREFRLFYSAFLAWRQANQWDNEMADHLPALFRKAGLIDVESHVRDEVVERGDSDFAERTALWAEVIDNVGGLIAQGGFCTETQIIDAREQYGPWVKTELTRQTLAMSTVVGRVLDLRLPFGSRAKAST